MTKQVLLKVSGIDAPGITAAIAACINQENTKLLDIEQAATHGLLSLMVLVELEEGHLPQFEKRVREELASFRLDLKFDILDGAFSPPDPTDRFVATVIAQEIPAKLLAELTNKIAADRYNIDSIRKLNSSGLSTIELICSSRA